MKTTMIAALAAAQLMTAAAPASAAERPLDVGRTEPQRSIAQVSLGEQAQELRAAEASESTQADAAQPDEPRKKRKSTGDKVLTGAAIVLGVGALAVGGLLVAIFVN